MSFEFATAGRIVFGAGTMQRAGELASRLGARALVVGGGNRRRLEPLLRLLADQRIPTCRVAVSGEPKVDLAVEGAVLAREFGADLVIGMGGGSAMDAAKAIAALLTNPEDPYTYLEVIGEGRALSNPAAPLMAIPTTAGTGAEVTRNAVLAVPERRVKVSLRHPSMLPRIALVDPLLGYSMPPQITASTGLDALTQCLEPFVSQRSTPLTDGFCREGMGRAASALQPAYNDGSDARARRDMALASLCGGLALANAKLGAVHGLAGPIGGMFDAPHGAVCARLLPPVMEANVDALRARDPDCVALLRYREVARILTGNAKARIADGVSWVRQLADGLGIPGIGRYGMTAGDLGDIIAMAMPSSSMKGNPIALSESELATVLHQAL